MNLLKIESVELTGRESVVNATFTLQSGLPSAELQEVAAGIKRGKQYELTIKERHNRRSLSANAYAWVLIGALAEKLGLSREEVYREQVRHYGAYQAIGVDQDDFQKFKTVWESKGLGWIVIPLNVGLKSEYWGRVEMLAFPGTSTYTTKEMATFIDGLVFECQQLGIETKAPEELAALVASWKGAEQ